MSRKRLPINITVKFDLGQGLDVGIGIIRDSDNDADDGHILYRLTVVEGSQSDLHRNSKDELWVNDFEVKPVKYYR